MKQILILFLMVAMPVFAQTSGTIEDGNAKLFYRTFGTGAPMLIINGGPGMNSDGFVSIAEKLSKFNVQTIIYDQRGTGKSTLATVDSTTVTMDLMVRDIETLRVHLKIDKWIVLGHSFGGMLASYYATVHPEHIESLILSSSGGIDLGLLKYVGGINSKLSAEQQKTVAFWDKKIAGGDTSHNARLQRGKALANAYVYVKKKENLDAIAERLTQTNSAVNGLIWQDLQRIKFDCAAKLASFNRPVLILQGKNDIIKMETVEIAQKALPKAKVVLMEHCGHYGWLDNPEVYFASIKEFIKS